MAKPAAAAGIATRRSRDGCVITSPRSRNGVPVSQLKTKGKGGRGRTPTARWRRIHAQLLATVVRRTAGAAVRLIRVVDDVLDRIPLRENRPDQVLNHRLVVRAGN